MNSELMITFWREKYEKAQKEVEYLKQQLEIERKRSDVLAGVYDDNYCSRFLDDSDDSGCDSDVIIDNIATTMAANIIATSPTRVYDLMETDQSEEEDDDECQMCLVNVGGLGNGRPRECDCDKCGETGCYECVTGGHGENLCPECQSDSESESESDDEDSDNDEDMCMCDNCGDNTNDEDMSCPCDEEDCSFQQKNYCSGCMRSWDGNCDCKEIADRREANQCTAVTKRGKRCKNPRFVGDCCKRHQ